MASIETRRAIAREAWNDKNYRLAFRLFLPMAMEGDGEAIYNVGQMHRLGWGVPENKRLAHLWQRAGSDRNDPCCMYQVAYDMREGKIVPEDKPAAVALFRRAAQLGDQDSQFQLGRCYELGDGVPVDLHRAMHWYRLAACEWCESAESRLLTLLCRSARQRA